MIRAVVLALFLGLGFAASAQPRPGAPAPELALPDGSGATIRLSDFKGRVVLLDFWASWCGPCRHNNPRLVRLYKKYHDKGFDILGLSLDTDHGAWQAAVASDRLSWAQVIDDKGWNAPSTLAWNVNAIPASFLIDRDGIIRKVDAVGWELESEIRKLLGRSL